jgi:hypothetical protein
LFGDFTGLAADRPAAAAFRFQQQGQHRVGSDREIDRFAGALVFRRQVPVLLVAPSGRRLAQEEPARG